MAEYGSYPGCADCPPSDWRGTPELTPATLAPPACDTGTTVPPTPGPGDDPGCAGCGWMAGLRETDCLVLTRDSATGACDCGDADPEIVLGYSAGSWTATDTVEVCGVQYTVTVGLTNCVPFMTLTGPSQSYCGVLNCCGPGYAVFSFGKGICTGGFAPCDNELRLRVTCADPADYWWCVDDGAGNLSCVPACVEPNYGSYTGVSGPYDSASLCTAACQDPYWCVRTGASCAVPEERACVQSASAPAEVCDGPFPSLNQCEADCLCPIPGYTVSGFYYVWDPVEEECVLVFLDETDSCDPDIDICTGPCPGSDGCDDTLCHTPKTAIFTVSLAGVGDGFRPCTGEEDPDPAPVVTCTPFNRVWTLTFDNWILNLTFSSGLVDGGFDPSCPNPLVGQDGMTATLECSGGTAVLTFALGVDVVVTYQGTWNNNGDMAVTLTSTTCSTCCSFPGSLTVVRTNPL